MIAERERELDRERRKLELRERRLGRRFRLLRAERDWFAPVKSKVAERADDRPKLEKRAAKLATAEQALAQREEQLGTRAAELDARAPDFTERDEKLETARAEVDARGAGLDARTAELETLASN